MISAVLILLVISTLLLSGLHRHTRGELRQVGLQKRLIKENLLLNHALFKTLGGKTDSQVSLEEVGTKPFRSYQLLARNQDDLRVESYLLLRQWSENNGFPSPSWTKLSQTSNASCTYKVTAPSALGEGHRTCYLEKTVIRQSTWIPSNLEADDILEVDALEPSLRITVGGAITLREGLRVRAEAPARIELISSGPVEIGELELTPTVPVELVIYSAASRIHIANSPQITCTKESSKVAIYSTVSIELGGRQYEPPFVGCDVPLDANFWPRLRIISGALS